jgi:hypothetical protein
MNYCLNSRSVLGDTLPEGADADVIEVPLLLPSWQVSALAALAQRRGQTAAAMVRALVGEFLSAQSHREPDATT